MQGNDKCSRCGREGEDLQHVVTCKQAEAIKMWKEVVNKLSAHMIHTHTMQPVRRAITESLKHRLGERGPWVSSIPLVNKAIEEQQKIGWYNFLMGMWSNKWKEAQNRL